MMLFFFLQVDRKNMNNAYSVNFGLAFLTAPYTYPSGSNPLLAIKA